MEHVRIRELTPAERAADMVIAQDFIVQARQALDNGEFDLWATRLRLAGQFATTAATGKARVA